MYNGGSWQGAIMSLGSSHRTRLINDGILTLPSASCDVIRVSCLLSMPVGIAVVYLHMPTLDPVARC